MREIFNPNEQSIMSTLIRSNQKTTKRMLTSLLEKYYPKKVIYGKKSLIAKGEIPIALVAHMDTVFENQNFNAKEIFYDRQKNVMWCPQNAGFDDKAGIFAILKIIQDGFRPWIIFTCDEETGGEGAHEVVCRIEQLQGLRYIIELDRQGKTDCVFYDCDNPDFVSYVSSFGFIEDWGTFTDISIICPALGVAGVNLSVGYRDEHTREEILYVSALKSTIQKVEKMLSATDIPLFGYIPRKYQSIVSGLDGVCAGCGRHYFSYEMFPVKGLDNKLKHYCTDCITKSNVDWCNYCDTPYELAQNEVPEGICRICRKDKKNDISRASGECFEFFSDCPETFGDF